MNLRLGSTVSLTLLAVTVIGCNQQSVGTVKGKVDLDGKPLNYGSIIFENKQLNIEIRTNLNPDGTFQVRTHDKPGLPPGTYRVAISPGVVGTGETPLAGKEVPQPKVKATIPEQYSDPAKSGLTAEVKAGDNSPFQFTLKSS